MSLTIQLLGRPRLIPTFATWLLSKQRHLAAASEAINLLRGHLDTAAEQLDASIETAEREVEGSTFREIDTARSNAGSNTRGVYSSAPRRRRGMVSGQER